MRSCTFPTDGPVPTSACGSRLGNLGVQSLNEINPRFLLPFDTLPSLFRNVHVMAKIKDREGVLPRLLSPECSGGFLGFFFYTRCYDLRLCPYYQELFPVRGLGWLDPGRLDLCFEIYFLMYLPPCWVTAFWNHVSSRFSKKVRGFAI